MLSWAPKGQVKSIADTRYPEPSPFAHFQSVVHRHRLGLPLEGSCGNLDATVDIYELHPSSVDISCNAARTLNPTPPHPESWNPEPGGFGGQRPPAHCPGQPGGVWCVGATLKAQNPKAQNLNPKPLNPKAQNLNPKPLNP